MELGGSPALNLKTAKKSRILQNKDFLMKKIMLIALLGATAGSAWGAASSSSEPVQQNAISPDNSREFIDKSAFTVLGLTPEATGLEIKNRFVCLSKKLHPDRNEKNKEAAAQAFNLAKQAYDKIKVAGKPLTAIEYAIFSQEERKFIEEQRRATEEALRRTGKAAGKSVKDITTKLDDVLLRSTTMGADLPEIVNIDLHSKKIQSLDGLADLIIQAKRKLPGNRNGESIAVFLYDNPISSIPADFVAQLKAAGIEAIRLNEERIKSGSGVKNYLDLAMWYYGSPASREKIQVLNTIKEQMARENIPQI